MRIVGCLAALALGVPCSPVAAQAAVPAGKAPAWAGFQERCGPGWSVAWCPATGTPEAVWGPGVRIAPGPVETTGEARRLAREALQRNAALLGADGCGLEEEIGHKVRRVYVFVYRQTFAGLPVIGGRADVRIHDNGVLSLLGSRILPVPAGFEVRPGLDPAAARVAAHRRLFLPPPGGAGPPPRLVVWGDVLAEAPGPVRLAFEVRVDVPSRSGAPSVLGRAYVDAADGRLLRFESDLHECGFAGCRGNHGAARPAPVAAPPAVEVIPGRGSPDAVVTGWVMAWTNTDRRPGTALVNVPLRGVRVGTTFTDADGRFTLPGTSATVTIALTGRRVGPITALQGTTFGRTVQLSGVNNIVQIHSFAAPEFERSQSTAYYFVDRANEFVRGVLGNSPELDRLDSVRSAVNDTRSCNATYSAANGMTFFHAAGGCVNTAYNSVILHEWGHGLDHEFGGIQSNEGMSEGCADTVSMVYNDDPIVGLDFSGPNTFVRTGTNSRRYPPSGTVHEMGEVWMGFCWDVRNRLVTRLGRQAGLDRLRELFLGVFVTNPTSQAMGVREIALLDDDDGNLDNGTPNCQALINAMLNRGLPNPIRGCPGFASYLTYGSGCPGTGVRFPACPIANEACTAGGTSGSTTKYALQCVAPADGAEVLGVDLYTRSTGGITSGQVELRLADANGRPVATAASTATLSLDATAKFWSFTFPTPQVLAPGQRFFVVYPGIPSMVPPLCAAAPVPLVLVPYWHQFANRSSWTEVPAGAHWAFRVRCRSRPAAIPRLTHTGVPGLGQRLQLHLESARPGAGAFLLFGASDRSWQGAALPLDLAFMGAPGCRLGASPDVLLAVTADSRGDATVDLPVPNDANLVGVTFYNQFAVFDGPANPAGLVVSESGKGTVGR